MEWLTPGSLVMLLSSVVAFAVAWGVERQARQDLERRHASLAEEMRREIIDLKSSKTRAEERASATDREVTALRERLEGLSHQFSDLRQSKASVESVDALREAVGRIDGKLDMLLRAVTGLAQGSKSSA